MLLRTIGVRFPDNKQVYHYFVPTGDDPAVGDMVVTSIDYKPEAAMVGLSDHPALDRDPTAGWLIPTAKMAMVVEISGDQHPRANKFYVSLISASALAKRQQADAAQLKTVQIQRDARRELDAMLAAEDKRQAYLRLAGTNPRARELLQTIGELPAVERVTARPKGSTADAERADPPVTAYNGNTDVDPQQVAPRKRQPHDERGWTPD